MIRTPTATGSFYSRNKENLEKEIDNCFKSEIGPGLPKPKSEGKKLLAGIVPHAGYLYSGPVAAHLYKRISEGEKAETYVILGPNHTGIGARISTMVDRAWATPFGYVQINSDLTKKIVNKAGIIELDDTAHAYEHSIEVQLPFLQYFQKEFRIVPICMMVQDPESVEQIGKVLVNVCKNENVTILASSDFTHFEPYPIATKKDKESIEAILALDAEKFYEVLERNHMTICGYGAIATAITYAREMGATKGELLKYATSGDITGDKTSVVGYASIEFK